MRHPLNAEAMTFPGDPDQTMFVYLPKPGSPSEHALQMLTALSSPTAPHGTPPHATPARPPTQ